MGLCPSCDDAASVDATKVAMEPARSSLTDDAAAKTCLVEQLPLIDNSASAAAEPPDDYVEQVDVAVLVHDVAKPSSDTRSSVAGLRKLLARLLTSLETGEARLSCLRRAVIAVELPLVVLLECHPSIGSSAEVASLRQEAQAAAAEAESLRQQLLLEAGERPEPESEKDDIRQSYLKHVLKIYFVAEEAIMGREIKLSDVAGMPQNEEESSLARVCVESLWQIFAQVLLPTAIGTPRLSHLRRAVIAVEFPLAVLLQYHPWLVSSAEVARLRGEVRTVAQEAEQLRQEFLVEAGEKPEAGSDKEAVRQSFLKQVLSIYAVAEESIMGMRFVEMKG